MKHRVKKRMYAVSCDGIGLIAGTLAYSRRSALYLATNGDLTLWEQMKRAGYRTVQAQVEVTLR